MNDGTRKLFYTIMAILVSVGAWMFVVYNYYPMTDVRYSDVPITFSGESELANKGLALAAVDTEEASATLNQKRIDINKYSSEDIEAFADVSNCTAGDNNVRLSVSGPPETSIVKSGPDSIKVSVERAESSYMGIDVIFSSDAPQNAVPVASDMSHTDAEIVCASSKLADVKSVAAVLDYKDVGSKSKSYTAELTALDADGNKVPHVTIYPEEITLDAYEGVTKSVSLKIPVSSKVNDDYERTYTAPETVTILGEHDAVLNTESISAQEIDIRYVYEDSELPVEFILPENVYIAKESEDAVLKVTVTKKETIDKEADDS